MWLQILRPYQLATVVVMAHPWVPDTGPILDLLAQAEGEPKAEVLMGTDRVPGTRGIGSWTLEWTGTFASSLTHTVSLSAHLHAMLYTSCLSQAFCNM